MTLCQWLSSNTALEPRSALRDNEALPTRYRSISAAYDMYHVILGQRIWSLNEYLAKPLADILSEQYDGKTLLGLIQSEDEVLKEALKNATALYTAYLLNNGLIAVEVNAKSDQRQKGSTSKPALEHTDDTVRLSQQTSNYKVSDD